MRTSRKSIQTTALLLIFLLLCGAAYVLAAAWSSMISYLIRMVISGSLLSAVVFFVLGAIGVAVDRITRKQV